MLMKIVLEEFRLLVPVSVYHESSTLEGSDQRERLNLQDQIQRRKRSRMWHEQKRLHECMSRGFSNRLEDLSNRQLHTADIGTGRRNSFQLKMIYTADYPAPHLRVISPFDHSSPLGKMRYSRNLPVATGSLGVLPPELLLMVLDNLDLADKTSLALTCTGFYRTMDGCKLWSNDSPGHHDGAKMEVLRRMEKYDDLILSEKLLLCSYCITFHRKALFHPSQYHAQSRFRECYLAYGQVRLGPSLRFHWSDVLAMANNSCRTEHAMVWREKSSFAWLFLLGNYNTNLDRRFRVSTDIYKVNHTICARTRWEFPYLAEAAHLGVQWYYLNSLPEEFELCPHNRFGRGREGGWIGRHGLRRCEERSHGFECMCYDLKSQRTTRCRFCATDIHHQILNDSYFITTDKILGNDVVSRSREWQSHGSPDERGFSAHYHLSKLSDDLVLREGGIIRDTLRRLEDGGSKRSDFHFPSKKELWGYDYRFKSRGYLSRSSPKSMWENMRVCDYLHKVTDYEVSRSKTIDDAPTMHG